MSSSVSDLFRSPKALRAFVPQNICGRWNWIGDPSRSNVLNLFTELSVGQVVQGKNQTAKVQAGPPVIRSPQSRLKASKAKVVGPPFRPISRPFPVGVWFPSISRCQKRRPSLIRSALVQSFFSKSPTTHIFCLFLPLDFTSSRRDGFPSAIAHARDRILLHPSSHTPVCVNKSERDKPERR